MEFDKLQAIAQADSYERSLWIRWLVEEFYTNSVTRKKQIQTDFLLAFYEYSRTMWFSSVTYYLLFHIHHITPNTAPAACPTKLILPKSHSPTFIMSIMSTWFTIGCLVAWRSI
jgi:hypothetical protein